MGSGAFRMPLFVLRLVDVMGSFLCKVGRPEGKGDRHSPIREGSVGNLFGPVASRLYEARAV